MNIIILIIMTAGAIMALIELLKIKHQEIGALIITGIAFIYIGFAGQDIYVLSAMGIQAIIFLFIAYLGLIVDKRFIPLGLLLHAGWDIIHLYTFNNDKIIKGYQWYCVGVDTLLAAYFYFKFSIKKSFAS